MDEYYEKNKINVWQWGVETTLDLSDKGRLFRWYFNYNKNDKGQV